MGEEVIRGRIRVFFRDGSFDSDWGRNINVDFGIYS